MEQVKMFTHEPSMNSWLKELDGKMEITRVLQSGSFGVTTISIFYRMKS